MTRAGQFTTFLALLIAGLLATGLHLFAQSQARSPQFQTGGQSQGGITRSSENETSQNAEAELQIGISLTHRGSFAEAIPHLLAARGHVFDEYATGFDLALCYVATGKFPEAVRILVGLHPTEQGAADVQNLLAQAYVGNSQPQEAFDALRRAAAVTPENEKLYMFVADACMDHHDYELGIKVADLGLQHLPQSARLHYQRAMFLSSLDQFDVAKGDFDIAQSTAPGSEIAYLAGAQKNLFAGNLPETIRIAREAARSGQEGYALLTILGQALIRFGAAPGQPEFAEAQTALEKSVAQQPNYAASQLALGQLYLMAGRTDDAVAHLEQARRLNAADPSVYAHLASAYRRQGDIVRAKAMLSILAGMNHAQEEKIRSAPGETKASYAGSHTYEGSPQQDSVPKQ